MSTIKKLIKMIESVSCQERYKSEWFMSEKQWQDIIKSLSKNTSKIHPINGSKLFGWQVNIIYGTQTKDILFGWLSKQSNGQ